MGQFKRDFDFKLYTLPVYALPDLSMISVNYLDQTNNKKTT